MRGVSLPRLLLAAGIILTMALAWVAVGNFRGARPIAEQNLTGIALSLAEAVETVAAKDPSLKALSTFHTTDLAYFAIIDVNGVQRFHSNPALIGIPAVDQRYRGVFEGSGVIESRMLLRTGEEVFEMNTPFHLKGQTLALRLVLHTYRSDSVVRRARIGLVMVAALLTTAWVMGLFLYRYALREEQYRREMVRRERMAHLGELGAVLAHEIRNPLAGIKGYAQLLQERLRGSDMSEGLDMIVTETLRLEELVNALMSYSRQELPPGEPVDISVLLAYCCSLVRPEAENCGVVLHEDVPEGLVVLGSRNRLEQLILNVLNNGLQAMSNGGDLRVEARRERDQVLLSVTDTGPGIPPGERERIFDPFFTTRPRGTGLGLAVCRKIAEEHGGRITAGGEFGNGAVFSVTLPALQKG
jgi:two-component system sensor histidine kinase HydH